MARQRRDTEPGVFHVTCHSVWTSVLFRDDLDRIDFLAELARAVANWKWTCLSYCLLTTHFHLILAVGKNALPLGMQDLNTRYACRFNAKHRLRGHVFDGRYDSKRIADERHLLTAYAYDANNPVAAGLCTSPVEWPWSSYAATLGVAEACSFVDASAILRCFAGDRAAGIAQLRALVEGSR
jgi:putative transposase